MNEYNDHNSGESHSHRAYLYKSVLCSDAAASLNFWTRVSQLLFTNGSIYYKYEKTFSKNVRDIRLVMPQSWCRDGKMQAKYVIQILCKYPNTMLAMP